MDFPETIFHYVAGKLLDGLDQFIPRKPRWTTAQDLKLQERLRQDKVFLSLVFEQLCLINILELHQHMNDICFGFCCGFFLNMPFLFVRRTQSMTSTWLRCHAR